MTEKVGENSKDCGTTTEEMHASPRKRRKREKNEQKYFKQKFIIF